MKWTNWWLIPITIAVIGFFGIFWTANLTDIDVTVDENGKMIFMSALESTERFQCSQYSSPYNKCDSEKQFMNSTGLYCDDRLVCENGVYQKGETQDLISIKDAIVVR